MRLRVICIFDGELGVYKSGANEELLFWVLVGIAVCYWVLGV